MEKETFSPFQVNENPENYQTLSEHTKNDQTISKNKEDPWFEMDECGFTDLLYSVFNQEEQEQEKQVPQEISPVLTKPLNNNKNPSSFSITSWEILNSYSKGFKMPPPQEQNLNHEINEEGGTKLSTEDILRIAGERFIQFSTNKFDGISMFIHPYSSSLSGFSMEETRDVDIVNLLLSAAENVGSQEFDLAIQLITRCRWMASNKGSPIQRLAFYFSEALQERVYRETNESRPQTRKLEEQMKGLALGTNNIFLATHQELPFVQVMQLAGIQAIIDNVTTNGKKIHVIDLQIRSGIQWTAMMQGLVDRKINHLKITAVGTSDQRRNY
ncbi:hypothetical protein ACJIZ3_011552 [Penstemon smallii]|uniref:Uncharacterized protein n=1 Tax=Penstemon smallii TaxID=265156 RepID=A0ABD3UN16_9LAMI